MKGFQAALVCATLALAPAGCAQREAVATAESPGTTFEVTPPVALATGATVIVALGVMAIVACGIACAN